MACWKKSNNQKYPAIDQALCSECGKCIQCCPHGVYDGESFAVPVVIARDACAADCTKCVDICPVDAITLGSGDEDENGCNACGGCF